MIKINKNKLMIVTKLKNKILYNSFFFVVLRKISIMDPITQ